MMRNFKVVSAVALSAIAVSFTDLSAQSQSTVRPPTKLSDLDE